MSCFVAISSNFSNYCHAKKIMDLFMWNWFFREIDVHYCIKMSCEDEVDLYFVKTPNGQEKFKLLQQAHCAKCWRPLIYSTAWPGSHENLRPPFQSALQTQISVTQCGHIFHTTCSSLVTHCPICQVFIQG